jgi:hypothetical protein
MKKKTIIYSLLLGVLLTQAACKEDNTTNVAASTENKETAQVTSAAVEVFSNDKKLKLQVEDFTFQDKLSDEAFLKTNPVPGVDNKDIVLLQQTNDGSLLYAVKNDKVKSLTTEQLEQKLKANTDFKEISVTAPTEAQKDISFKYQYAFTDSQNSKTYNESCIGLKEGYLVCATSDKDFILLDRLVNTAQLVKQ